MRRTFDEAERAAVYRVIAERRDIRQGFLATPIGDEVLLRVLGAAQAAPSVGLMQPSRFVVVRDAEVKQRVRAVFERANKEAAASYTGTQAEDYCRLKLEGICEAPVNVCVLCDAESEQGSGLGRHSMPEMAVYSTVCAVQNLWLAARAEGLGVGWVSILDVASLRAILKVPESLTVVAYLCVGYVDRFGDGPELERVGWERRRSLESVLAFDCCNSGW